MAHLGPRSHETLLTMDTLGQSRWQQGRYSEAKSLQQHAVDGLIKLRGSKKHEDTLSAMGNLGRTLAKFYENLEDAESLLEEASDGMQDLLGPTHLKTLAVKEDLSMLTIQMNLNDQLPKVLNTMQHILDCRKDKLGKEHPFTLLAMISLARAFIALKQYDEAESLVREGLHIADRNLGEDHIGTLMGRTVLGTIFTHQSRYKEAEAILRGVIEKQRSLSEYRGDFHPDRIGAMIEIPWCLRVQGKLKESIQFCETVINGLGKISSKQYPLERKMRLQKEEMARMIEGYL